ncbi:unnamed protein product [Clonostachys rosea]|uniref:CsbD-like domain-containing protein n=1 Tax=Bionectria ochroleuca TaxID=29856 RepID=A0ABY6UQE4_BIOOC|nr:unnamed protein product [Clonostachys rosea]
MSQQRDPYGIPINPHRSYEQYGANAMNEGGGFLETRGQGYAENMTTEGQPRQEQARKTENISDQQGSESQRYGSDSRDDDMYGIGLGGGDRHHVPGDLETTPGNQSSRRQDEDLYDRDTGLQQQEGLQQSGYQQEGLRQGRYQQEGLQQSGYQQQDEGLQRSGYQQDEGLQQGRQQQSTGQGQKGDSMLGKFMEKTGGVLGSKNLEQQGRDKRNDPSNYD